MALTFPIRSPPFTGAGEALLTGGNVLSLVLAPSRSPPAHPLFTRGMSAPPEVPPGSRGAASLSEACWHSSSAQQAASSERFTLLPCLTFHITAACNRKGIKYLYGMNLWYLLTQPVTHSIL